MRETIEAIIICVWRVRPDLLPNYYKSLEQAVSMIRELSKPNTALSPFGNSINEEFYSYTDDMIVLSVSLLKDILLKRINAKQALTLNPQSAIRTAITITQNQRVIDECKQIGDRLFKDSFDSYIAHLTPNKEDTPRSSAHSDLRQDEDHDRRAAQAATEGRLGVRRKSRFDMSQTSSIKSRKENKYKNMDMHTILQMLEKMLFQFASGVKFELLEHREVVLIEKVLAIIYSFVLNPTKYEVCYLQEVQAIEECVSSTFRSISNFRAFLAYAFILDRNVPHLQNCVPVSVLSPFHSALFIGLLRIKPSWRDKFSQWILEKLTDEHASIYFKAFDMLFNSLNCALIKKLLKAILQSSNLEIEEGTSLRGEAVFDLNSERFVGKLHDIDRVEKYLRRESIFLKTSNISRVSMLRKKPAAVTERYPDKWIVSYTPFFKNSLHPYLREHLIRATRLIPTALNQTAPAKRMQDFGMKICEVPGALQLLQVKKSRRPRLLPQNSTDSLEFLPELGTTKTNTKTPNMHESRRSSTEAIEPLKRTGYSFFSKNAAFPKSQKTSPGKNRFNRRHGSIDEPQSGTLLKAKAQRPSTKLPKIAIQRPDSSASSIPSAVDVNLQAANQNGINPAVTMYKYGSGFRLGWGKNDAHYLLLLRDWIRDSLEWRKTNAWNRIIKPTEPTDDDRCLRIEDEVFQDHSLIDSLIQVPTDHQVYLLKNGNGSKAAREAERQDQSYCAMP